jgi:hypothetical protein
MLWPCLVDQFRRRYTWPFQSRDSNDRRWRNVGDTWTWSCPARWVLIQTIPSLRVIMKGVFSFIQSATFVDARIELSQVPRTGAFALLA